MLDAASLHRAMSAFGDPAADTMASFSGRLRAEPPWLKEARPHPSRLSRQH